MKTITINVYGITGHEHCVDVEDGKKLFQRIKQSIDLGAKVELSFLNIQILTASFLNYAIGQLYGHYDYAKIKEVMSVTNISNDHKYILKKVTDNAKEFYKRNDTNND